MLLQILHFLQYYCSLFVYYLYNMIIFEYIGIYFIYIFKVTGYFMLYILRMNGKIRYNNLLIMYEISNWFSVNSMILSIV